MEVLVFRAVIAAAVVVLTHAHCSVCGDGLMVGLRDALFTFDGQPAIECGALEQAGTNGHIPLDQCGFLPPMIKDACGCTKVTAIPVSAPASAPLSAAIPGGDCSCYGNIPERKLFNLQPHPGRQHQSMEGKTRFDALQALSMSRKVASPEEACECVEVCDDDYTDDTPPGNASPVDDDEIVDDDIPCEEADDTPDGMFPTDDKVAGKGCNGGNCGQNPFNDDASPGGKTPRGDSAEKGGKGVKGSTPTDDRKMPTDDKAGGDDIGDGDSLTDDNCICSCFRGVCDCGGCSSGNGTPCLHTPVRKEGKSGSLSPNDDTLTVASLTDDSHRHLPVGKNESRGKCKQVCTCKPTTRPSIEPAKKSPPRIETETPTTLTQMEAPIAPSVAHHLESPVEPPLRCDNSTEEPPSTSADCISTCICRDGEKITVEFANPDPLPDDWVGLYKCNLDEEGTYNYHPDAWLWTCYDDVCSGDLPTSGTLVFEHPMPDYNNYGPHTWPLEKDQCYVALLNRNIGRSPPPYDMICEGIEFLF